MYKALLKVQGEDAIMKAICHVCHREITKMRNGHLRRHVEKPGSGVVCEGAWQIPEEPKERGIKMEGNYHDLVQM